MDRRREAGRHLGAQWKGKKRPGQLEKMWQDGVFDSLRGRIRSSEEIDSLRASFTPERRQGISDRFRRLWKDPSYRDPLLEFHRSQEERVRRSREQAKRIAEDPAKWIRGKGSRVVSGKCERKEFWVRSTYEKAAVEKLESDFKVVSFEYEKRLVLDDRSWILPDFVVTYLDGATALVEVKAAWTLQMPVESEVRRRLDRAHREASKRGWLFFVWTEEDLFDVV